MLENNILHKASVKPLSSETTLTKYAGPTDMPETNCHGYDHKASSVRV